MGDKLTLKILTTNRHEVYLKTMAKLGHHFTLLTQLENKDLSWHDHYGAPPENMQVCSWGPAVKARLKSGYFDYLVLHTVEDLVFFRRFINEKTIFIIHLALYKHRAHFLARSILKLGIVRYLRHVKKMQVVAVSPWKRQSWGLHTARCIPLSPLEVGRCYSRNIQPRIMTAGNHFSSRPEMNAKLLKHVQEALPVSVFGQNPDISSSCHPASRSDFLEQMRNHDIFLFTTERPWNDGYNTAVLEAMSAGLAVVSMQNPSSPIEHGRSGYLARSYPELINYLHQLSEQPQLTKNFGQRNREIIAEKFSFQSFLEAWCKVLL